MNVFQNLHPVWFVEWRCTRCHAAGCAGIRDGGVGAAEILWGRRDGVGAGLLGSFNAAADTHHALEEH